MMNKMDSELERLVDAGKVTSETANKIDQLSKGAYCLHKSWGVGQVDSWDLLGDRILINFIDKPKHGMKLQFASVALDVLEPEHVLSQRFSNLKSLQKMAEEEPVELIRLTLLSHGSSMSLDQVDAVLKGAVVSEGKYKGWWDRTKKELRKDRQFVVPSKRNVPLELRAPDVSPSDAMVEDVLEASDLKAKAKAVEAILNDPKAYDDPVKELLPVVQDLNDSAKQNTKMFLAQALDLILARNDLQKQFEGLSLGDDEIKLAEVLKAERPRLGETLRSLGVARQRQILEVFPEAFGDEWIAAVLEMLNDAGLRGIGELTKFLVESGKQKELSAFLRLGLQQRGLDSNLIAWICRERADKTADLVDAELPAVIMAALERDHFDEGVRRSNRLAEVLQDDHALIPDLVENEDINAVRGFARRLLMSPAFDELTRKSLLARIVKIHPEIQELITGGGEDKSKDETILVSWASLEAKKADLDHMVNVLIPQNKEEIQIARSYGDLRENFEYKAAKQQQAVLNRQRQEYQQELEIARGTDFANVDASKVAIGTVVELEEGETYTILGAWDGDPDKNILSYTAEAAQALIGLAPGEEAELPTETGDTRKVKVKSIKAYKA